MFKRIFRFACRLVCCIALTSAGAAAQPDQPGGAGFSPLDLARSPIAQRAGLSLEPPRPLPVNPASPLPTPLGDHPSRQMGEPSPLLGAAPPLKLSRPQFAKANANPSLLQTWGSAVAPVGSLPTLSPSGAAPASPPPVGGTWTLGPKPAGSVALSNPLLLTDGSVIAHVSCSSTWYKLTPDANGSYVNGSWAQIASTPSDYTPRFFASAVLPDGRVIAEGGEYNTNCASQWSNKGAIYDPVKNTWTAVTPPSGWTSIGDAQSSVLANGTFMLADCCSTKTALLNASNLTWTATGTGKYDWNDEESWSLLPSGEILTVDAYVAAPVACGTNSEKYSPLTGAWTSAGSTPTTLADCLNATNKTFEIGPQNLRPDGTVVAFGGTTCGNCASGNTSVVTTSAIYNSTTGLWSSGPNIPKVGVNNYTLDDAPSATLPNGNVLFAAGPNYAPFKTPTHFFELSAADNTISAVADPTDANGVISFQWNLIVLPTGQVMALETDQFNVWIYTPTGSANAAWAPSVSSVPSTLQSGATLTLSGSQLNGLTQGAGYGDDAQSATNYPIVKITNTASGHVAFARSFNHSSMTVAPNAAGSTTFTMPENVEPGASTLSVIANGVPSAPVNVTLARSVYAKSAKFNADANADLLWRDNQGVLGMWLMNGATISSSPAVAALDKSWSLVAAADFDGDGKSDILWRNADGTVGLWFMNGATITSTAVVGAINNNWMIVGAADFDGDGKADILWRNVVDGSVAISLMNGSTVVSSTLLATVNPSWTIVGVGDFYGDNKSQILWRNSDGTVSIWRMNGASIVGTALISVVDASWTIEGVGDFDGNGKSDILWRNQTGTVGVWLMNGASIQSTATVAAPDNSWQIAATGDFNGDGKTDIVWRQATTGTVSMWLMNGGAIGSSPLVASVDPTQWRLIR